MKKSEQFIYVVIWARGVRLKNLKFLNAVTLKTLGRRNTQKCATECK